eukprot:GILI01020380.1.p1 GENE.GILI01020380.1~~GILI01020380.1.p1  ORF type:complete len:520 (-),score=164.70 GILI01020380.1:443-1972(-)
MLNFFCPPSPSELSSCLSYPSFESDICASSSPEQYIQLIHRFFNSSNSPDFQKFSSSSSSSSAGLSAAIASSSSPPYVSQISSPPPSAPAIPDLHSVPSASSLHSSTASTAASSHLPDSLLTSTLSSSSSYDNRLSRSNSISSDISVSQTAAVVMSRHSSMGDVVAAKPKGSKPGLLDRINESLKSMRKEEKEDKDARKSQEITIWLTDILPHWEKLRNSKQVQKLVLSGIPSSVRGRVWVKAIGNALHITPDLHQLLSARAKEAKKDGDVITNCNNAEMIGLDLHRTFPKLKIFQQDGPLASHLKEVLETYAYYRPDLGYVQGMAYLAAMLLLYMDSYNAFVSIANLLNRPAFIAFFRFDMVLVQVYFKLFERLLDDHVPAVARYFKAIQLTPDMYLVEWLYTLYGRSLPLEVASRVWDCFLLEGEVFMFKTALGLLHYCQPHLLNKPFEVVLESLRYLTETAAEKELFESIASISLKKSKFLSLLESFKEQELQAHSYDPSFSYMNE